MNVWSHVVLKILYGIFMSYVFQEDFCVFSGDGPVVPGLAVEVGALGGGAGDGRAVRAERRGGVQSERTWKIGSSKHST